MVKQRLGTESDYFGRVMSTPPTVRFEDEDGNPTLGPSPGTVIRLMLQKVTIRIMNGQSLPLCSH